MPIVFTKEEVRGFLEEQGFDVSNEETLQKFIRDLKKLIKYEDQQRRRRRLGHHPNETLLDSTDGRNHTTSSSGRNHTASSDGRREKSGDHSSFSEGPTGRKKAISIADRSSFLTQGGSEGSFPYLGEEDVDLSREMSGRDYRYSANGQETGSYDNNSDEPPELTPPKDRVEKGRPIMTTPKKKPGNRLVMRRLTAAIDEHGESVIEESDVDLGPVRRPVNSYRKSSRPKTAPLQSNKPVARPISTRDGPEKRVSSARNEKQQDTDENRNGQKPDTLYYALRNILFLDDSEDSLFMDGSNAPRKLLKPPPHVARDPVALYHWYKTYSWNIYSIPGEDRHMQLRWNVRAQTVGYHPNPCLKGQPAPCKQKG